MTYDEFEKSLKALGCKPGFLNKGVCFGVHPMLAEGETVKGASFCIDPDGPGSLIVTENNFYSYKKTGMLSVDSKTIPIDKISTYSVSGGLLKDLIISEGTNRFVFKSVQNYESIISAIQAGKSNEAAPAPVQPVQAAPPQEADKSDITNELRKYKALLDEGLITQDDFDKKKALLLGL